MRGNIMTKAAVVDDDDPEMDVASDESQKIP